jgi:predicted dehydrogenase
MEKMMEKKKTGVVGVGAISDIFLENMIGRFHNLDVVGCTARNRERIQAKAEKHGIAAMTMDEMFADPSIEIIVNLTPVPAHYEIIKRALEAGKHVYTEKSLALNFAQAKELLALSESKGLRLGCAPDTFLGSGIQTAAAAIDSGMIGDVTGFTIMLNRGLGLIYESVGFLRQPGGGVGYDYGIYALTSLFSVLGPAVDVCGFAQTNRPVRDYQFEQGQGKPYAIENENVMVAAVRMRNGALGSITFNGDSIFPEEPYLLIQGTKGMLRLPDPNAFGGEVVLLTGFTHPHQIRDGGRQITILPTRHKYSENCRGIGVADMAAAMDENRPHRASATMATHLLELLDGIVASSQSRKYVPLTCTFDRPAPLSGEEIF